MSAFVVSKKHVASIVGFYCWTNYDTRFNGNDAEAMANKLMQKNVESVQHRYPDCRDNIANCPGPIDELKDGLVPKIRLSDINRAVLKHLTPVQALKAISCLDYQSCELPGWEKTEEYRFLERVKSAAIRRLPGYEEAPWEID